MRWGGGCEYIPHWVSSRGSGRREILYIFETVYTGFSRSFSLNRWRKNGAVVLGKSEVKNVVSGVERNNSIVECWVEMGPIGGKTHVTREAGKNY